MRLIDRDTSVVTVETLTDSVNGKKVYTPFTIVTGQLQPVSSEFVGLTGSEFGKDFFFFTHPEVVLKTSDKLIIDGVNYYVKGYLLRNALDIPFNRYHVTITNV
jgi:hypothetical protein